MRGRRGRGRLRLDLERFKRERYAALIILVVAVVGGALAAYALLTDVDVANVYTGRFAAPDLYRLQSSVHLENVLKKYRFVAVMFESPTCPHCREMYPYWHMLELMQDKLKRVVGAEVHLYHIVYGPSTSQAFQEYRVEDTPTFILFADGRPVARHIGVFAAENVTKAMLEWLKKGVERANETGGVLVEHGGASESIASEEAAGVAVLAVAAAAALAAGVITAFSPCVLPALLVYLSSMASMGRRLGLGECVACGVSATLGALAIAAAFAVLGGVVAGLQQALTMVMGFAVIAVGLAALLGVPVEFGSARLRRAGLLGFCGAYGVLALQCTLPLVAGALLLAAGAGSVAKGLVVALSFAVGMGGALTATTLAVARLGRSFAERIMAKSQLFNRIAGLVMLVAGLLLIVYNARLA